MDEWSATTEYLLILSINKQRFFFGSVFELITALEG
jgi:hypothetical protein